MDSSTSTDLGCGTLLESLSLGAFTPCSSDNPASMLRGSSPRKLAGSRVTIGDVTEVEFLVFDLESQEGSSVVDSSKDTALARSHVREYNSQEMPSDEMIEEVEDELGVNRFMRRAEERRFRRSLTATVGKSKTGSLPAITSSSMW
eukprot:CAMPEP_0178427626 /NCGR_PEP_ID=MMETSP0689_2-20121128/29843_1 /TAXON_ID=160604 /ORGANISM="Amphidinium massartii, Strain CS-259" /LENGTH=145 /DNA_ID=CAMNT_0020049341 /DNA_START=3 /DNA_END=437 /DNA_ORIENTATION=-